MMAQQQWNNLQIKGRPLANQLEKNSAQERNNLLNARLKQ